jgi:hypothetical protein
MGQHVIVINLFSIKLYRCEQEYIDEEYNYKEKMFTFQT